MTYTTYTHMEKLRYKNQILSQIVMQIHIIISLVTNKLNTKEITLLACIPI